MKTIRHLLAVVAFACSLCGYATDYYVDAVNGNDANSGLAAGEGNAMESFAALFAKYTITSGSVVHAAPGVYTNGVMTGYRVIVPAGVTIVADEGPENTIIKGASAEGVALDVSPFGCGTGAIRCVYLGEGAIVKDFTLTDGHSPAYDGNTYIGAVNGSSTTTYVIGCVVTNNVAGRAAGVYRSAAIRCFFDNNRAYTTGCDVMQGSAFNCLFGNLPNTGNYNLYQGGPYVNNTFYGSGSCAHAANSGTIMLYNSLILKGPASNVYCTNSVLTSASIGRYESTKIANAAAARLDADYRPLRDSPCIDVASWEFYTNRFPSAVIDEATKDFLGNPRIVGAALDAGACESQFATGVPFDWHVDAVNGSDANDGTSAEKAFQNLSMALTNSYLRSGDTVHAAPGLYTNGVITSNWRFRAVVPAGVALVGDAGAERTFIVGEPDPAVELNASPWGCGSGATLCVRLWEGSSVRGFTLTGGRAAGYSGNNFGAAVYCGDDRVNNKTYGYVVDCIITNNCAARGAGTFGAVSVRCKFADNRASQESSDIRAGCAFNCLFGDVLNTSTDNFFGSSDLFYCANCTFYGSGAAGRMNAKNAGLRNCVILKNVGQYMILSNCVYTGSLGSNASAGNSKKVDSVEAVHLDASYRPLRNSPALDKGDATHYTLPAALADESGYDILKAARVQGLGIDIGAFESSESLASTNWYVNVETGSDANDGATEATPFKTLAAAMTNGRLAENDIVNVAEGTYSDGEMTTASSRKYRVVVPAGVTLLGAGADKTIIEGAEDRENGTEAGHWCGPNALACVKLYAGSIVRGVTLTKGHTPAWEASSTENWGGAVQASGVAAYVVDCVISNNFAGRGAGFYGGTAVRCRFNGNGVASTGTDIMQGSAYNCIFGDIVNVGQDSVYQGHQYVNCVFYGAGNVSHDNSGTVTNIWNSIVLRQWPGTGVRLINCATTASSTYSYGGTSITLTQAEMMLDENYAPRKGSPLIDRGRNDLYAKFPVAVAEALAKTDLAGSQRVYNGTIDIGAYEYDWRGDFAKRLKRSQVEVVSASADVVTNVVRALTVPSDASIEIDWRVKADGRHTFYAVAEGEGSVFVTCDGVELSPTADGLYTFIGTTGETRRIVVSCSDGASAVLRDFRDSSGLTISFR